MKVSPFLVHVTNLLQNKFGESCIITEIHPEFGGSINESFRLVTTNGTFFLKRNIATAFPDMFDREAQGLKLLSDSTTFKVPTVLFTGSHSGYSYLMLEYVQKENPNQVFWKNFGKSLAEMHKQSHFQFGLDHSNFIGSLVQSNLRTNTWADFFVNERIVPLVSIAHEKGKIDLDTVKQFEKLCFKIPELFPVENPSLLHGDLWSGNYFSTNASAPCVFDPAVYYGHREMDIAMMHLFGGFHVDTYKTYEEIYPLQPEWKKRIDLCNIYPLLVHTILFGGTYIKQVKSILNNFK